MNNKVIFYAPVGNLTKGFKSGGAEAGCKKTMEVLQKGGYKVLLVEKPSRKSASMKDGMLLAFALMRVWLQLIILFSRERDSVFHIAGFYLNQAYFERLLVRTAKFFKVKCIYEIRNGGMIESYQSGTKTYQYLMDSIFKNATLVLSQGYDYVVFLKEKYGIDSVYYPNYIMDNFINANNVSRNNKEPLRLIYFGRVVPDKNIEFILDVCDILIASQYNLHLDVIGSYEDDYFDSLMRHINAKSLVDSVTFHGRMEFKDIYTYLQSSHFFIFPSKEKREGHSNALTEAMGCGVVPIASEAGFNKSVVGLPELIVSDFEAKSYASRIKKILDNEEWLQHSNFVYNRVISNYTESIVKNSLLGAYVKINN